MLLEFRTKNYKSFKDELVFSMTPAPKQTDLGYSILKQKIGSTEYKGLSTAVIYGPNASGKTNIIGAMDTFKDIILRGNIRNSESVTSPNAASHLLELIPCCSSLKNEPIEFSIKFIENGLGFIYSLSIDVGGFLAKDYSRKILAEGLTVNGKVIFSRGASVEFGDFGVIKGYLIDDFEKNIDGAQSIVNNSLNDEELFLLNGFKVIFSSKLVSIITEWLEKKFIVVYRADSIKLTQKYAEKKKETIYIKKTLNEAAKVFGINSNAIGYFIPKDASEAELYSLFEFGNNKAAVPAEYFESYGTMRFVNEFPLVINALLNGATLVIDEFDASIHPMALMSIINIFHNDDINKKNAQLVFNTHNPIFLNANLFRRDEIKFVERDDETHLSTHYSLSDFGTSGKSGVRKGEDYMNNYFVSRYGAIKDIDFSPLFENISEKGEGK
ncbi:MAG: ATP-binding protein [Clostridiales bacterium]|nr:ATP-binding protein [Clostridiales bacterium]